jgi:hypothetical protein
MVTFLKATQNKEAVHLYIMAKDAFPGDPPFSFHHTTVKEPDEEVETNKEEVQTPEEAHLILEGLRKLYVGEQSN